MSLLLDTQALLWFLLDDPRLSGKAQASIVAHEVKKAGCGVWNLSARGSDRGRRERGVVPS